MTAVGGREARKFLDFQPSPSTRTKAEVQEALADALDMSELGKLLSEVVEAQRQELEAGRRSMQASIGQHGKPETAEWIRGIDDISPGTYDLLTAMILFPE